MDVLPLEIWEEIFFQALPGPSCFKEIGFNVTEFIQYDPRGVLCLSQVSRFWRQVVVSCPFLWTCLPNLTNLYRLDKDGAMTYFKNRFRLIHMFIERAQALPLHVTLIDRSEQSQMTGGNTAWHLHPYGAQSFFSTSNRWKSLTIRFVSGAVLYKYAHDIQSCSVFSPMLPNLDTLTIRHDKPERPYFDIHPVLLSAPKLMRIQFIGMIIDWFFILPWKQITRYNGGLRHFNQLGAATRTVQELVLKCNLLCFETPGIDTAPFIFTKLTRLKLDNVDFRHKLPKYWTLHDDDTVLRWVEAPLLQSLEITAYQALRQAPSIVNDLTASLLRVPHNSLRQIVFHVDGMTRHSLINLLQSTPRLEILELWGVSSEVLSTLDLTLERNTPGLRGTILAPKLRHLVVREWQDSDAQSLLDLFDSRRSDIATMGIEVFPIESIDLVYQNYENCRKARDIVEGWGVERAKVFKPGSEYQKIHGYSTHLAKEFLVKDLKRNPRHYGVSLLFICRHLICFRGCIFQIRHPKRTESRKVGFTIGPILPICSLLHKSSLGRSPEIY